MFLLATDNPFTERYPLKKLLQAGDTAKVADLYNGLSAILRVYDDDLARDQALIFRLDIIVGTAMLGFATKYNVTKTNLEIQQKVVWNLLQLAKESACQNVSTAAACLFENE